MRHRIPDRDIIDTLTREIKEAKREIRMLQQTKNPTMPEYDPSNVPSEFPEGGFFVGTDNAFYVKRNGTVIRIGP